MSRLDCQNIGQAKFKKFSPQWFKVSMKEFMRAFQNV